MASNTGCTSDGEVAITFRMSAVAVCRSSASLRLVEQPRVLDGDHGLVGEGLQQTDCLVVKGSCFAARDADRADCNTVAQHRHHQHAAPADRSRKFLDVLREIGSVNIGADCKFSGPRDLRVNAR